MKRLLLVLLLVAVSGTGGFSTAWAQDVPDVEIIREFEKFEKLRLSDPEQALRVADSILTKTDEVELRLAFAQAALEAGKPGKTMTYLEPLPDQLEQVDPRLTEALDMMAKASDLLGKPDDALTYGLMAYNSAEARLGSENPTLLSRLDALEPKVKELRPELAPAIQQMRAAIDKEPGDTTVRAAGDPTAVRVWYGTNRKPTGSKDPADFYGTDSGELTVGSLTVTIPPNHMAGLIEQPEGWFFTEHLDPQKHVVLAEIKAMAQEAFANGCCEEGDRLLFIHGYNVSFYEGALRAAQLSYDLEFPGEMLYYSWPSKESLYGYLSDANNVVSSRPAMETFFEMATRGSGKLHVIAHSMGNRYTLEALETFFLKYPDRDIGQLILAAPDVDRAEFQARFESIRNHVDGVTLYASKHDLALQVSRRVNGAPRLGDANGDVVMLTGLDTVDASQVEADLLGHSYFGDASQILGDILGLVRLGWRPDERCAVSARDVGEGGSVWDVMPDGCPVESIRAAGDLIRLYGADAMKIAQDKLDHAPGDQMDFWTGVMDLVRDRLKQE